MATVTVYTKWDTNNGHKCVFGGVTLSSNYTLAGESIVANDLGMNALINLVPGGCVNGYPMQWDNVAGKMYAFGVSNALAATNGSGMMRCQGGVNFTGAIIPFMACGTHQ